MDGMVNTRMTALRKAMRYVGGNAEACRSELAVKITRGRIRRRATTIDNIDNILKEGDFLAVVVTGCTVPLSEAYKGRVNVDANVKAIEVMPCQRVPILSPASLTCVPFACA